MNLKKVFLAFLIILTICGSAAAYAYYAWMEAKFPHNNSVHVTQVIGNEPVNYLVMGSDSRGEKNARADTLVIFRIDPKHNLSYLISIPRDLKVNIPGHGSTKINSATAYGGPELMIKTLKEFTGLDINHYALLNFKGFRQIINSLGGIEVNVKKPINSNEPGYEMHIKKGRQVLNGNEALNFVRFRHDAEGDLGRIKRQQLFFRALSDELLSFRTIPKIPGLVSTFADNTQTDMSSSEIGNLAWALRSLDKKRMQTTTLEGKAAYINGVSFLLPDEQKIKSILSDIKQGRKIDTEKPLIKIKVLNGSGVPGKALTVKNSLVEKGFNVVAVNTSSSKNNGPVIVYCRSEDKDKAKKVASAIPGSIVKVSTDVFSSINIDVIVLTGKSSQTVNN